MKPRPRVHRSDVDLGALWPNLVDAIGRASPFARSYFLEAHPVSFVKNVFTIGFDPEFADHIGMVDNAKNHTLIATKLAELGIPGAQVKIIKAERPEHFTAPAAPIPAPAIKPATQAAGAPRRRHIGHCTVQCQQLRPNRSSLTRATSKTIRS